MQARLVIAVVAGIAARLTLAALVPGNWDQVSYAIVRDIVDRGGNVYLETSRYN